MISTETFKVSSHEDFLWPRRSHQRRRHDRHGLHAPDLGALALRSHRQSNQRFTLAVRDCFGGGDGQNRCV